MSTRGAAIADWLANTTADAASGTNSLDAFDVERSIVTASARSVFGESTRTMRTIGAFIELLVLVKSDCGRLVTFRHVKSYRGASSYPG
jgi:hypothetical protein